MRILPLIFLASLSACTNEASAPQTEAPTLLALAPQAPDPALGPSIYDLKMDLEDQNGRAHGLDIHAGHPTLISMFYGSCKAACPLLISDLKRVEAQALEAGHSELRVLMVSFDPERDTTQVMAGLVADHELDGNNWRLSAPRSGDARSLGAVLNVSFRDVGDGMFQHDSVLILLNSQGQELARLDGLNQDSGPLLEALGAP
jgi:protein SCO1/2